MTQRLQEFYQTAIVPTLQDEFSYKSAYQIPRIEKVVINRGIGDASSNSKLFETFLDELTTIAGQKCVVTRSKKAIAGFQLRPDVPVGLSVVLRGDRMYAFLDRLIHLAFPRIRDFQGISPSSFDGRGNYSIGLREQLMFPELEYEQVNVLRGMDVCIVTTAKTDQESRRLLKLLGMPFERHEGEIG
jgi:large subunit ribosomal protein L5